MSENYRLEGVICEVKQERKTLFNHLRDFWENIYMNKNWWNFMKVLYQKLNRITK